MGGGLVMALVRQMSVPSQSPFSLRRWRWCRVRSHCVNTRDLKRTRAVSSWSTLASDHERTITGAARPTALGRCGRPRTDHQLAGAVRNTAAWPVACTGSWPESEKWGGTTAPSWCRALGQLGGNGPAEVVSLQAIARAAQTAYRRENTYFPRLHATSSGITLANFGSFVC